MQSIFDISREVAFFEVPEKQGSSSCKLSRHYLAFLFINDKDVYLRALNIGQSVKLSWYNPLTEKKIKQQSLKWNGKIIPPLTDLAIYGNLILLVTWHAENTQSFTVNKDMSLNMEVAADPVWIIPTNSDVLARRLVNAVNLAYKEQLVPHQKLL